MSQTHDGLLKFKKYRDNVAIAEASALIARSHALNLSKKSRIPNPKTAVSNLIRHPSRTVKALSEYLVNTPAEAFKSISGIFSPLPPPPTTSSIAFHLPPSGTEAAEKVTAEGLDVCADFVLVFKVSPPLSKDKSPTKSDISLLEWKANLESAWTGLADSLHSVGISYEIREAQTGFEGNLKPKYFFVFLLIPNKRVQAEARKELVEDWLNGVRLENPLDRLPQGSGTILDLPASDRIRLQYRILTNLSQNGGAGIHYNPNATIGVVDLFPLHDDNFNADWVLEWSTKLWISGTDLTTVRNHFGEKIAFYFSFLKSYTENLLVPSTIALLSLVQPTMAFPSIHDRSPIPITATVLIPFWSMMFVELLRRRGTDLAVSWGALHVSRSERQQSLFNPDSYVKDVITGKTIGTYSTWKRLVKQALVFPVVVGLATILGTNVTAVNILEVLIAEHYEGNYKQVAQIIPSVAYSVSIGPLTKFCYLLARKLNDWENHETETEKEKHLARKMFIFNSLLSFTNVFLATFIYVPFGSILFPRIAQKFPSILSPTAASSAAKSRFTFVKIRSIILSLMIVKQIKNTISEVFLPFFTPTLKEDVHRIQRMKKYEEVKKSSITSGRVDPIVDFVKSEKDQELNFLNRVKREWKMSEFDVDNEYTEMAIQFGQVG
ncbi:hypothetical protein HK096_003698, partial [Nowakowskiella sp. JEL0078]